MELSVLDLSKYLEVSPDTVERWLRQGKLPVSRRGANVSFEIKELENWASKRNINLKLTDKTRVKKQPSSDVSLSDAIHKGGVYSDINANSVETVLQACLDKNANIPEEFKPELFEQLLEREQALSTGIGNGVAIPHPRQQQSYLDCPMVSVFYLSEPVDYNALDNKPVSVLFIILCPVLKMHLQLLSSLSFCLREPTFLDFLKTQPGIDDLIDQIQLVQEKDQG